VKKGLNLEQATGQLTHDILNEVMTEAKINKNPPDPHTMQHICDEAVAAYKKEVEEKGFDEVSGEVELEMTRQSLLAEGLARAWTKVRLPYVLEHYKVVSVEEEHDIPFGDNMVLMSRPDVTLERKVDGELVAGPEFKTTGWMNEDYIESWRYSTQTLSHCLDVEHSLGRAPVGVAMEFLYKGVRRRADDGSYIYYSPLVRGFKMEDEMGNVEYGFDSSLGRKKDWNAFDVAAMGMENWFPLLPDDVLDGMLFNVMVMRNPDELDTWVKQTKLRQARIQAAIIQLFEDKPSREAAEEIMCNVFPARMDRYCFSNQYHKKCPYLDICYGRVDDPIGSGKFVEREPHHPGEFGGEE
jgi:hypothetical protein